MARNSEVSPYIGRLGRNSLKSKKGLYKRLGKNKSSAKKAAAPAAPSDATKEVAVKGSKNGSKRVVPVNKAPRFYSPYDEAQPKATRKAKNGGITRLRSSITPGTVLILLAGKYRGRRVVFLKQLESGLLLVSGPAKLNNVPLRRVNQAYVIATSTKIDISAVKVPETFNDAYFKRAGTTRVRGTEGEFFKEANKAAAKAKEGRAGDHKAIDKELLEQIKKTPEMAKYLATPFALSNGQFPHLLKF